MAKISDFFNSCLSVNLIQTTDTTSGLLSITEVVTELGWELTVANRPLKISPHKNGQTIGKKFG